mgnify:CR=1 FL=1
MVKLQILNGFNNYIHYNKYMGRNNSKFYKFELYAACLRGGSGGSDIRVWENNCHKTIFKKNEGYKPYNGRMKYWFNLYDYAINNWGDTYKFSDIYSDTDFKFYMDNMCAEDVYSLASNFYLFVGEIEIHNYLEIRKFRPSLFITISPNWKDYTVDIIKRRDLLRTFVEDHLSKLYGDFYDYAYAVECGKQGSHIHVHCVLEINDDRIKTVRGRVKNNYNYKRSISRCWSKMEGAEGLLDDMKHSIEIFQINTKTILKDKLDYLIEDLKPIEHQNANISGFPLSKSLGD